MSTNPSILAAGQAFLLESLITPTEQGIASRTLAKAAGGNLTPVRRRTGQCVEGSCLSA